MYIYMQGYVLNISSIHKKKSLYKESCLETRRILQNTNEHGRISNTSKTIEK